jgi:type II secretory pathway pseudopilin PulG
MSANTPDAHCAPTSDHYQDYANFAATVAKRYPLTAAIEVWNEENGAFQDPAGYAQLLQDTYQAVHPLTQNGTVAPDMKVLLGGLTNCISPSGCSGNMASPQFLADVYTAWGTNAGAPTYMDGIGLHPYPDRTADDGQNYLFDEVRDVRDDFGDSGRSIYVTETGISTTPSAAEPDAGNTTPAVSDPVDEAEQAIMVAHFWNSLSPQPDIAAVLLHTDIGSGDPTTNFGPGDGMIDNNDNNGEPGVSAPPPGGIGWRDTPYRIKPGFCVNASLHAGSPYSDSYQCPSGVQVPSLTSEPASGNLQAQTDVQAAYEIAREYFQQNGTFTGLTQPVLYNRSQTVYGAGSTWISSSGPSSPASNNPGATADPSQIDIVQAAGQTLEICNSGTGDTSYCIVRTSTNTFTAPNGCSTTLGTCTHVAATAPNYREAIEPTTGDRAALTPPGGTPFAWEPPSGY